MSKSKSKSKNFEEKLGECFEDTDFEALQQAFDKFDGYFGIKNKIIHNEEPENRKKALAEFFAKFVATMHTDPKFVDQIVALVHKPLPLHIKNTRTEIKKAHKKFKVRVLRDVQTSVWLSLRIRKFADEAYENDRAKKRAKTSSSSRD